MNPHQQYLTAIDPFTKAIEKVVSISPYKLCIDCKTGEVTMEYPDNVNQLINYYKDKIQEIKEYYENTAIRNIYAAAR